MKESHLDRILGRIDDLDASNLNILIQRLISERRLLETVFDKVREGIVLINADGAMEYWNHAAARMLGLEGMDIGSSQLWKAVPELRAMFPIEAAGVATREMIITYPRKRYVRFFIVPLDEENPTAKSLYTVIFADITEDRKMTQEMVESETFNSIFHLAAGVAHELGNPLNSIGIHLQVMQRKLKANPDPALEKSLSACMQEVQRLDKIIENFLKNIRPQGVEFHDLRILEILSETLNLLKSELNDRKIRVDVEIGEDVPIVLGDKTQLGQVFYNLIKNSIDAIGSEGDIQIVSQVEDDYVALAFKDSGKGIDDGSIAQVFEPHSTTKDTGSGLGMMIIQRIIRDHSGQIGIDSEVGVGTTVTVKFPRKEKSVKLLED